MIRMSEILTVMYVDASKLRLKGTRYALSRAQADMRMEFQDPIRALGILSYRGTKGLDAVVINSVGWGEKIETIEKVIATAVMKQTPVIYVASKRSAAFADKRVKNNRIYDRPFDLMRVIKEAYYEIQEARTAEEARKAEE